LICVCHFEQRVVSIHMLPVIEQLQFVVVVRVVVIYVGASTRKYCQNGNSFLQPTGIVETQKCGVKLQEESSFGLCVWSCAKQLVAVVGKVCRRQ